MVGIDERFQANVFDQKIVFTNVWFLKYCRNVLLYVLIYCRMVLAD